MNINLLSFLCPICGESMEEYNEINNKVQAYTINKCPYCDYQGEPTQMDHEWKRYCGEEGRALKIEELSRNPLFNKELYEQRIKEEIEADKKKSQENLKKYLAESERQRKLEALKNVPKCPTCNSTNIKKISTTRKVVGAGLFGLLSKDATSQFCCGNCGYKW